jgi:hypothetical protein
VASSDTPSRARRWPKVLETFRIDRTAASGMWAVGAFPWQAGFMARQAMAV